METARGHGRRLGPGRIDRARIEATTADDMKRHMIEDGLDPDNPLGGFRAVVKASDVRRRAKLSQVAFARALHVPVKTIRNWEQGRSEPDPATQALLKIVAHDPDYAFRVLAVNAVG